MKLGPLSEFEPSLSRAWNETEEQTGITRADLRRLENLDPSVIITPPRNRDEVPDWPWVRFNEGVRQISRKLRQEVIIFTEGRNIHDYPPEFEELLSSKEYIYLTKLEKINDSLRLLNPYPDLLKLKEKFETEPPIEIGKFPCYIPAFNTRACAREIHENDLSKDPSIRKGNQPS